MNYSEDLIHEKVNYSIPLISSIRDKAVNRVIEKFPLFLHSKAFQKSGKNSKWNYVEEDVSYYVADILAKSNQIEAEDKQDVYDTILEEVKEVITAEIEEIQEEIEEKIDKFDTVLVKSSSDKKEYIVDNMIGEYCRLSDESWMHQSNLEVVSKYELQEDIKYEVDNVVKYNGEDKMIKKIEGSSLIFKDNTCVEMNHPLLGVSSFEYDEDMGGDEYFETDVEYESEEFETAKENEVEELIEDIEASIQSGDLKNALTISDFLPKDDKKFIQLKELISKNLNNEEEGE